MRENLHLPQRVEQVNFIQMNEIKDLAKCGDRFTKFEFIFDIIQLNLIFYKVVDNEENEVIFEKCWND